MNKSESINELAKALAMFQAKVKQPLKDANNPFFKSKYVPLENVVESITESAGPLGLSFIQYPVTLDNKVGVITILMHESGQWIETEPVYTVPAKQDPQGVGSAITYMKRYSLSAVFGITSDEDDDGNSNSPQPPKQQYQPKQQQAPKQDAPPTKTGMISPAQLKALQVKVKNVAAKEGKEGPVTYAEVIEFCGIKPGTSSTALTVQEATKVICYLDTLEQQ